MNFFKDTIPKENQIKIIVSFVVVALLITLIIIFRNDIFRLNESISDAEKFYKQYTSVTVDNVFKYVDAKEALELMKSESAVIFFGFESCTWCQSYAPILNEVAKEKKVGTVYYCDIKEDRANNTEAYQELTTKLKKYLYDDDDGNKRIYVPDVYFIKDGKIVGHNNDTSTESGTDVEEYYSLYKEQLKKKLSTLFDKVAVKEKCDDSKKGC